VHRSNLKTQTKHPRKKKNSMNRTKCSRIGFLSGVALLGALTGCVGYVNEPHHAAVYAPTPVVYVDDYVYYPGYQVYYSSHRHQYIYQDGHSWVTRPAPPRVSVDVLVASPSVRLDFHDSPSLHHATVARQYPKHWAPPGSGPNHGPGNKDDGKGNDHRGSR
jgi:hypothetical protein